MEILNYIKTVAEKAYGSLTTKEYLTLVGTELALFLVFVYLIKGIF